jgi:hypothetical protein
MPAGPVVIDLTHRDAPIEISDDSESDDAELPVAIEPPQPVSSVVRQRNVNERRARLLQRGIDEEAEERARQRQIARDEQIARRLQAMGGEGDIDVIQISSGEDSNDDTMAALALIVLEDIHAAARRLARQEREWQELRNSPPRRRYPRKFLLQSSVPIAALVLDLFLPIPDFSPSYIFRICYQRAGCVRAHILLSPRGLDGPTSSLHNSVRPAVTLPPVA